MSTYVLPLEAITKYVEGNIGSFHEARLGSLRTLKLKQILKRKNPYLFKAKHVIAVHDLVKLLLNDLEFERDGVFYIVSIKSGPNWGNADQIRKMRENFARAIQQIQKSHQGIQVVAVNGCCYGQDAPPNKGDYFKYCGQEFWALISGRDELYTQIIEPVGHRAKEKNEEFVEEYAKIITTFTVEFANEFCTRGKIDWVKLVKFNSGKKR